VTATAPGPHRLLFVCTANIARSPMAEALASRYARERGWGVEVASAGTHAIAGNPAAPNSVKAVRELGCDLSGHVSRPVDDALVSWADRVLVMELRHARHLRAAYPVAEDKVLLLANFGGMVEIDDPFGRWIFAFRRCRDELRTCVEAFMDRLPYRPPL
jgi:protein-tyrosine-phosphatase